MNCNALFLHVLLLDRFAVVENAGAVKEEHVVRLREIHEPSGKGRRHIPDVHDRDLSIALREQRGNAAAERIAEDHQLPVRFSVGVFDREQCFRPAEEHFVSVAPRGEGEIVDRDLRARFVVVHAKRRYRAVREIAQRVRFNGKGVLPGVHAAKRRGHIHGLIFRRKRSAHRRGDRRRRFSQRFLPPMGVGAVVHIKREGIENIDILRKRHPGAHRIGEKLISHKLLPHS